MARSTGLIVKSSRAPRTSRRSISLEEVASWLRSKAERFSSMPRHGTQLAVTLNWLADEAESGAIPESQHVTECEQ